MTLQEMVNQLKEKAAAFDASGYSGFLAVQVTLSDLEGPFYVEVKDGKLSIEPYEYHDRQANMIMTSADFKKMINKKLSPTLAFTTGRLKIEGDIGKATEMGKLFKK